MLTVGREVALVFPAWRNATIMPTMTPTTHLDVLDAAEHMPLGSVLVVNDFSWDEYELLNQDLDGRRNPRLSYDCGRLEVVSTSSGHDKYAWFVDKLIWAFCEAHDLPLGGYGHATWKLKRAAKGSEGDGSYYITNEQAVFRKKNINLEVDPPPDIIVEVDLTTDSLRKLSVYSGLGVPEVWRYDGEAFHFHGLTGSVYTEIAESRCLPGFTVSLLMEAMQGYPAIDSMEALRAFRRQIKKLKK
jgi:Uma2 family endonuclease